jgi:hypothetical protein
MMVGMLVILALLVSTLGLVAIVNGANLAAFFSGGALDSQQVAEAGADLIIATFNRPENRKLLVAGSTPISDWSTTNDDLQSPCLSSTNTRPGSSNGHPQQIAINMSDGNFRDLEKPENTTLGDRTFRLVAVRYSTGENGSQDRRTIYRTFKPGGQNGAMNGAIPTENNFSELVNLDDPDGSGSKTPGSNSGFIAITVEGSVSRADGTTSTSRVTKEYEVVPKCCGGSFGSNGSGGTATITGSIPSNSLGADSRYCGTNFGVIIGINGGRINLNDNADYYSTRDTFNAVKPLREIMGIIAQPDYVWDRKTTRKVLGPYGQPIQVGCRTEPNPCNTYYDNPIYGPIPRPSTYAYDNNNPVYYIENWIRATPSWLPDARKAGPDCYGYGDKASYEGRATSCTPIIPTYLATGLPSIDTNYTYNWTTPNTISISQKTVNSASENTFAYYPYIKGPVSTQNNKIWLRANSAVGLQTRLEPKEPFLEYCNTKYLEGEVCVSSDNNPSKHTWAIISQAGNVTGGISDDFESNSFSGWKANSTPRWPKPWEENDQNNNILLGNASSGDVKFESGVVTLQKNGNNTWDSNDANAPAIARAVNLYALKDPVLEFTIKIEGTNVSSQTSALMLSYAYDSTNEYTTDARINTNEGWDDLAKITAGGSISLVTNNTSMRTSPRGECLQIIDSTTYTCRVRFPQAAYGPYNPFSHYVKFRLRANSPFGGANQINKLTLDDVAIKSYDSTSTNPLVAPSYLNWCEYSSTFPDTPRFRGGFHCLGPTISLNAYENNLYLDTSDESITLYYNRREDTRGLSWTSPLIWANRGGSMQNVSCTTGRGPKNENAPIDNCKTLVPENSYNPPGYYERLNIFGRQTTPLETGCSEAGELNTQPCMQYIIINSRYLGSTLLWTQRSKLSGVWIYMPWGYLGLFGDYVEKNNFFLDDSWIYSGRIWVRTLAPIGQTGVRVPPSSSVNLTSVTGASDSTQGHYIAWDGTDWIARSTTATFKGFTLP